MSVHLGVLQAAWHCVRHLASNANPCGLYVGRTDSMPFRHDALRKPLEVLRSFCCRHLSAFSSPTTPAIAEVCASLQHSFAIAQSSSARITKTRTRDSEVETS